MTMKFIIFSVLCSAFFSRDTKYTDWSSKRGFENQQRGNTQALACSGEVNTLPELERRSRVYQNNDIEPRVDDFYLNEGWYEVNNHLGQYAIPDKRPNFATCGTQNPIYLQDEHPDLNVLGETPIEVTACRLDDFDECGLTYKIQIRLCNGKLNYYLKTVARYSAYCFDPPELQDITDIPPAPVGVKLGTIKVVPALKFNDVPETDRVKYFPYLEFQCSFNIEPAYLYTVTWYYDGKYIETYGPSNNIENLKLLEETLLKKTSTLGINIVCGITVSTQPHGFKTRMETSPDFFAGIKVENPLITLDKSDSADIKLVQTVPIGCRYTSLSDINVPCSFGLAMADPDKYECHKGNIVNEALTRRCGIELQALKKSQQWNEDGVKHTFKVTTQDENYEDRSQYRLHLQTDAIGHTIWLNYLLAEIQVSVVNTETYKGKICYSHIDPHMKTGDGCYYENQRSGDYMLYKNTKYGIEVQERLIPCNGNRAWCACALGVKVGADIFIIDLCNRIKIIDFKVCKDGDTMTVVKKSSTRYQIYTAIGTIIEAVFYGGNTIMNIDITMAPKDIKNTEGLCGYVDGNKGNDFRKRDKTITDSQTFAKDWRLKNSENVFLRSDFNSWFENYGYFCVCKEAFAEKPEGKPSDEAICSPKFDLNCKRKDSDKKQCTLQTRKRRSVLNKKTREIERKITRVSPMQEMSIQKRDTISEDDARTYCTEKITGSLAFTRYVNQTANEDPDEVINQCLFDVAAAGDLKYADIHVDSVNTIVAKSFELTPEYVANNTDEVTYFKENSCPNNCSGMGTCNKEGVCECARYFHGSACEIDERIPPEIVDTEGGGVCDLQDGDGCSCLSFSTDYLLENFTCEIKGEITYEDNSTEALVSSQRAGRHEDIFTGFCCVPDAGRKRRSADDKQVFTVRYDISISNNGRNFGNYESIFVIDSGCQTYTNDNGSPNVYLKGGYCYIDGQCKISHSVQGLDDCYMCKPESSTGNWTFVCIAENDDKSSNHAVILGTTLGIGSALIIVVVSFLSWKFLCKDRLKKRKSVGDSRLCMVDNNTVSMSSGGK